MVDAVLKDLPEEWNGVVVMDWSDGFWDSLLYEESEIESPEWHRDILEERKRKIKNGKAEFISPEELKASRKSCELKMS